MIVVKVELWPLGSEEHAEILGTAVISNDATGDSMTGNYDVRLGKFDEPVERVARLKTTRWRNGRVEGFPRRRLGPWDLLYRALRETVGDRNP